ncbi:MAG: phosphopyruvate hydratase [Candidatus Babeliaceae bacterium]|jgi:enolase
MKITQIIAREIYDSRGLPTVQCEVVLENTVRIVAAAPSGLSRSKYEAHELRDGGKRLWGLGVLKAVENIESMIAPALIGQEPNGLEMDLKLLEIDGTSDKSHLGSNATLATSMAIYKAQAYVEQIEPYELIAYISGADSVTVPFPLINVLNGGLHANNNMHIQEFMIVPLGAANFRSSFELSVAIFHELKNVLQKNGKSVAVGDEGGYAPMCVDDEEALILLCEALARVEQIHESRCVIALDVAASRLYDPLTKTYLWNNERIVAEQLVEIYSNLIDSYPIYSIEDGLSEEDWDGWKYMTHVMENKIQLVGDDIFATHPERILEGVRQGIAQAVVIKPNQIGTITETLHAIRLCKLHNLNVIVSHRSGETEDTFIADLAVGASAGQIKAGGCSRTDRIAKYNRLLMIEDQLMLSLITA